ncbi:MAG: [acyl-carrier-protein] S-malonyltransferase [candidate division Zixibacteria bacterium HGW-Zixibacteria-1]|nr:MAG: [acyl-carrier-protein] S-malonyltransferase [candidate division Zixibacteria bacterium HGW-Zixibacteria-1]
MGTVAVVFPGQASQYVGMGRDLYESNADVRKLYDIASKEIGEDIAALSFNGPAEKLKETRFTQPAILLHSLAVLTILKDRLPTASLTAGHSLGEYGSLALSGVLSPEDAIRAVVKRSALMEEACRKNKGTMAAIMGLDETSIAECCEMASAKGVVVPANYNSANQIVISGAIDGVEEACRLCKEKGAKRAIMLEVGGAFHSPLMEPARDGMRKYLAKLEFAAPRINVIPNVTGRAENDPEKLKELLVDQITSPVRWYQTMQYIKNGGVDTVFEIGPGKVLSGLFKRELNDAQIYNIDTLEDIEKYEATRVE